jgi:hypothetical protein
MTNDEFNRSSAIPAHELQWRGAQQARCQHCGVALGGFETHAEECPYPADQARLMQNAYARKDTALAQVEFVKRERRAWWERLFQKAARA